jgi:hypothetical protein
MLTFRLSSTKFDSLTVSKINGVHVTFVHCALPRCMTRISHELNHETAAVMHLWQYTKYSYKWQLCFKTVPSWEVFLLSSHRRPQFCPTGSLRLPGTSRGSGCAQPHDKINALYFITDYQKLEFTNWQLGRNGINRLTKKSNIFRSWYQKSFQTLLRYDPYLRCQPAQKIPGRWSITPDFLQP